MKNNDLKRDELLDKFSPEFKNVIQVDAYSRAVYETLLRNEGCVYEIIEGLLKNNISLHQTLEKITMNSPQRITIDALPLGLDEHTQNMIDAAKLAQRKLYESAMIPKPLFDKK